MQVPSTLVDEEALERLQIVPNAAMNRGRGLRGVNSYGRELGLDAVAHLRDRGTGARWLDLCCGGGRALLEAAAELGEGFELRGVDLVDSFASVPTTGSRLHFCAASASHWPLENPWDLVTIVHGLHYVGEAAGFKFTRHVLKCHGPRNRRLGYRFMGADPHAGPNYTMQPAVTSWYERTAPMQGAAQSEAIGAAECLPCRW